MASLVAGKAPSMVPQYLGGWLVGWSTGLLVASVGGDEEDIPAELNVINLTVACTTGNVRNSPNSPLTISWRRNLH